MRRSCIVLLVMVLLVSMTSGALAWASFPVRDYSVTVAGQRFGFTDWQPGWNGPEDDGAVPFTILELGSIGRFQVPFSALQGCLAALFLVLAGVVMLVVFVRRGRSRHGSAGGEGGGGGE